MAGVSRLWMSSLLCIAFSLSLPNVSDAQSSSSGMLKPELLEQLVAPIALYPDALLAEVLMASTYPLEVVAADRWVKENKALKGDALKIEAQKKGWDQSVSSLTATPEALDMMSGKLDWTQSLGDAVLAQQTDVMDAIQRLRNKAQDQKKLATTSQQTVSVKKEQGREIIVIESAKPDTIYVPYYDPAVVYGPWPYPTYPPYYFPPPAYVGGAIIATGIAFGTGYAVGRWASGGNYWGGGVNWGGNSINVNRSVNVNNTNVNAFVHKPEHRHGVKYRNDTVQQKFGKNTSSADRKIDFRGHDGRDVLQPGKDRPGGSDRPNAGDRPGGKDRPGTGPLPGGNDRPGAADRPGSKDRPNSGDRPGGGDRSKVASRPDVNVPKPDGKSNRPNVGGRDNAFSNVGNGGAARAQADRGRQSLGGGGGGGGRPQVQAGGGGNRGGGGGDGRGGGGGGRGGGGRGR